PATSRPTTRSPTPPPSTAAPTARSRRVSRACDCPNSCPAPPGAPPGYPPPRRAGAPRRFPPLRSLAHTGPCHDSGPQQLFTSFPTTVNRLKPDHPDLFAVVDRLRADPTRPLPNNVGVPPIPYLGAAYLGPSHEPFTVHAAPNDPKFHVPNIVFNNPEH